MHGGNSSMSVSRENKSIEGILIRYLDKMDSKVENLNSLVIEQSVNVQKLDSALRNDVFPVIHNIPNLIQKGVHDAQLGCPLLHAWNDKEEELVEGKLSTLFDSNPPKSKKKKIPHNLKIRLIEALVVLIIGASASVGSCYYFEPSSVAKHLAAPSK